ncbi:MAG: response regulator [Bacteroidetes bacterium]|nr:response regulator [Bacteroidota bacterium]
MNKTRILLADSQYLVREGLKAIVSGNKDMEVVGEAGDAVTMGEMLLALQPDLVILDHDTAEFYGDASMHELLDMAGSVRFLIISQDHHRGRITSLLERGVNAFLTKYCDEGEIVSAIRAAIKGEKYFCSKVLDILIDSVREDARETCAPSCLTLREIEIVRLIASGAKTRDVAGQLHLSPHTVNTHRKNIFKKLGIRSGNELVLYALNTGILQQVERTA